MAGSSGQRVKVRPASLAMLPILAAVLLFPAPSLRAEKVLLEKVAHAPIALDAVLSNDFFAGLKFQPGWPSTSNRRERVILRIASPENLSLLLIENPWLENLVLPGQDSKVALSRSRFRSYLLNIPDSTRSQFLYLDISGYLTISTLAIHFMNASDLADHFVSVYIFTGAFYAILLLFMLYAVVLYFNLKERASIFYAVFILAFLVYIFLREGYLNSLALSNGVSLTVMLKLTFFMGNLSLISFMVFTNRFLGLAYLKNSRMFFWMLVAPALVYPVIIIWYFPLARIWISVNAFIFLCFANTISIYLVLKKKKNARVFLEAYAFMLVSMLAFNLINMGVVPFVSGFEKLPQIGFLSGLLRISFHMGSRIKELNQQRINAEKKSAESLRTLNEENRLLLAISSQISGASQPLAAAKAAIEGILAYACSNAGKFNALYLPIVNPARETAQFFYLFDPSSNASAQGSISAAILNNLVLANPEYIDVRGETLEAVIHLQGCSIKVERKSFIQNVLKYLVLKLQTLRQASQEKLAIVGSLASGIVHDIRNNAYIIKTLSSLVYQKSEGTQEILAALNETIDRITGLSEDILDYARGKVRLEKRTVWLDTYLEKQQKILEPILSMRSIKLHFKLDYNGPVELDPTRFQRVIYNLASNAADAITGGGNFSITTWKAEKRIFFQFVDDGPGIESDIQPMIFEPFFTGKMRGTGLGLAVVQSIIEAHNGQIYFETQAGKGTAFTVSLPFIQDSAGLQL